MKSSGGTRPPSKRSCGGTKTPAALSCHTTSPSANAGTSVGVAVGNGVVDLGSGTPVKDIAIRLFGTGEKTALVIGTVLLALIFGILLGLALGFMLFGEQDWF